MKNHRAEMFIATSISFARRSSTIGFLPDPSTQCIVPSSSSSSSKAAAPKLRRLRKIVSVISRMNRFSKKMDNFAQGIREHVRLGSKLTETIKGKWNIGTRIIKVGGVEKVFKQIFSVGEGEELLKVSQCYLSTTAGPVAGLLFISTDKIAFCSERSIKASSPTGKLPRIHYKVLIPIRKIDSVRDYENMENPSSKYIRLVTKDDFEFWFMGFLNIQTAVKHLQQAVSQAH